MSKSGKIPPFGALPPPCIHQSILDSMADLTAIQDPNSQEVDIARDSQCDIGNDVECDQEYNDSDEPYRRSDECLITLLAPHKDLRRDFDYLSEEVQNNIKNVEKAQADWKGKFFLLTICKNILERNPGVYSELRTVSESSSENSSLPSYQQLFDDDSDTDAIATSDIQSPDEFDASGMNIFEGERFFCFYKF
jgi:hypothetical protein